MSLNIRLFTPALLLILACTPKDEAEGGDASTGAEAGTDGNSTTSGDAPTTSDSDPSNPSQISGGTADDGGTATTPGTTPTSDTEASDEVTSVGTSVGTTVDPSDTATDTATDTDTEDPVDPPPVMCEGAPKPIEATTIMAYNYSQVPDPDPSVGSVSVSTSGTGGDPIPPETMFIKFSDLQFTCEDPNANVPCGAHWEFTVSVPPEFQFPGVYNLAGSGPYSSFWETAKADGNDPDDCGGGGGGGFGGTFEIINITDTTVEGRLCGIDDVFSYSNVELNGSFVAARCK